MANATSRHLSSGLFVCRFERRRSILGEDFLSNNRRPMSLFHAFLLQAARKIRTQCVNFPLFYFDTRWDFSTPHIFQNM